MIDKFTILIGTCDKYSFLWNDFVKLFNRYWDDTIKVKKYFLSETLSEDIEDFEFITPGKIPYSDCIKNALDIIQTPYVLWLQDDYFLRKKINKDMFEYYFNFIEENNVNRFGIKENSRYYNKTHVIDNVWKINQNSMYTISMQASIWEINFFKSCLISNESPWDFEIKGTKRLNKKKHNIYFHLQETPWYIEGMKKGKMTSDYHKIKEIEKL